ncbi:hypothetical protein PSAC2689_210094 [Paraburkholderia sacchari]|uniref:hypothetical protein n=1 Tax=Paraburkholderia sacchari TaxID=159450 RepID=UPI0039A407D3
MGSSLFLLMLRSVRRRSARDLMAGVQRPRGAQVYYGAPGLPEGGLKAMLEAL